MEQQRRSSEDRGGDRRGRRITPEVLFGGVTAVGAIIGLCIAVAALAQANAAQQLSRDANSIAADANDIARDANNKANEIARTAVEARPVVRYVSGIAAEYGSSPCAQDQSAIVEVDWSFTVDVSNHGGIGTALRSYAVQGLVWVSDETGNPWPSLPPGANDVEITTDELVPFDSADSYARWLSTQGPWDPKYEGRLDFGPVPHDLASGATFRLPLFAHSWWRYPLRRQLDGSLARTLEHNTPTASVAFDFANGSAVQVLVPVWTPFDVRTGHELETCQ